MRWVRTRVFPEPGPASTNTGPSSTRTAFCCAGLRNFSKSSDIPIPHQSSMDTGIIARVCDSPVDAPRRCRYNSAGIGHKAKNEYELEAEAALPPPDRHRGGNSFAIHCAKSHEKDLSGFMW